MIKAVVAVLATLDTKHDEARFVCDSLSEAGVMPWLVDLSLRPHATPGADIDGGLIAAAAQSSWDEIAVLDRASAAEVMNIDCLCNHARAATSNPESDGQPSRRNRRCPMVCRGK